jgi:hypothetical protein
LALSTARSPACWARAFEDAWQKLTTSEGALADERRAVLLREVLAKRIIELGRHGERNHDRTRWPIWSNRTPRRISPYVI